MGVGDESLGSCPVNGLARRGQNRNMEVAKHQVLATTSAIQNIQLYFAAKTNMALRR